MDYANMVELNKLVYTVLEKLKAEHPWRILGGLFGISEGTLKEWHFLGMRVERGENTYRKEYTRAALLTFVKYGLASLEGQLQQYADEIRPLLLEIQERIPLSRFTLKVEIECEATDRAALVESVRASLQDLYHVIGVY